MCRFLCVHNISAHLGKCHGSGVAASYGKTKFSFNKKVLNCLARLLYQFASPPAMSASSCSNSSLSVFGVLSVLNIS